MRCTANHGHGMTQGNTNLGAFCGVTASGRRCSGRRSRCCARWVWLAICICLTSVVGCAPETRVVNSTWDRFADDVASQGGDVSVAGRDRDKPDSNGLYEDSPKSEADWAILIRTFNGKGHAKQAKQFVKQLQQDTNMSDLWTKKHDGKTYVYRGRYFDPNGFAANDELRQARMTRFEDERPFQNVRLAQVVWNRIESGDGGKVEVTTEMDLSRHANRDLYSLQVGVYDEAYGKERRHAAEQFAAVLRADGNMAFFCHKLHMSMVTVGLFAREEAFVPIQVGNHTQDGYSPAVHKLQQKHPYNLLNGRTIILKERGKRIGEQPSCLVQF